jgi:hypothetical protein
MENFANFLGREPRRPADSEVTCFVHSYGPTGFTPTNLLPNASIFDESIIAKSLIEIPDEPGTPGR